MPDDELAKAIKLAKAGKQHFFALVVKGGDSELSLARKKVPAGTIAEMKKSAGGGAVVTGICTGENGELVFTTAKASATLAAILKKCIKEKAGLTIACEVRKAGDAEEEEEEDEKEDQAKAAAEKKRVTKAFADLVKANGDKIKASRTAATQARNLKAALDGGRMEEAEKLLAGLKKELA